MSLLKKRFFWAILLTVLFWIIIRATFVLQFLTVSSTSNEPALHLNDLLVTSILKKPKRFDFICFRAESPDFGKEIWVFRACGLPGDTVELRNGVLYVNGRDMDRNLQLTHGYIFHVNDTLGLNLDRYEVFPTQYKDSIFGPLSNERIEHKRLNYRKYIMTPHEMDPWLHSSFPKHWNRDNFGPLKVPPDKYFVLGDNRSIAIDSRQIGLVHNSDFLGTVFLDL